MNYQAVNFAEKLAKFSEQWSPKIIAQMNDYHFKLVKLQGEEHKPFAEKECKLLLVEPAGTSRELP